MNKKCFFIAMLIASTCLFLIPAKSHSQEAITKALQWLTSVQETDGSWGSWGGSIIRDTTTVADAFMILDPSSSAYLAGLEWLVTISPINNDATSRRLYTFSKTNYDGGPDLNFLMTERNPDGGWGLDADHESDPLDTSLALQALKAANYLDQNVINSALGFLLSTQNPDGGWGFYPAACPTCQADPSNVYMTAMVLRTLSQFRTIYNLGTPINNAVAYLQPKQNPDGGFGTDSSIVYETALSFLALVESGQGQPQILQNTINYLSTTQLSNGSWNNDPYSTALALRTLVYVKPNLSISSDDITFSNPAPKVGDTIIITADIKNAGVAQVDTITVHFFDGDPASGGTLIGEVTIPLIPASGSNETSLSWTIPTASSRTVFVKIDPFNSIDELDETDNIASKNATASTLPDLSITPADITFNPATPTADDPITISAIIRNKGEASAENVTVDIYEGDPSSGGIKLGASVFPAISAGSSVSFEVTSSFPLGGHSIYVIVDDANSIEEGNEKNNSAIKLLQVGVGFVDLSIDKNDIVFNPNYPSEGNMVTIIAGIKNNGEKEIQNVPVKFFLNNPATGGTQLGPEITIPLILAKATENVSVIWDTAGHAADNDIYVLVDPSHIIYESDEYNNMAFRSIRIAVTDGPDLTLSSNDIRFIPSSPNTGETVTLTASIRNVGSQDAANVPVEFSLGNPNIHGTLIIGMQTIPFIAKGNSANAQITWNSAGFSGIYNLHANVDSSNEIPEINENNNTAYTALEIKMPQAPDLTVTSVDTASIITDTQALTVSGAIKAVVENKGNKSANGPFEIKVFEDRNGNKTFDSDFDNVLGNLIYPGNILAGSIVTTDIPISGKILFRNNLIYITVDTSNIVQEVDETNNTRNTGQQCIYSPPTGRFNPVVKWAWTSSSIEPDSLNVMMTPSIIDLNRDGIPDIVFASTASRGGGAVEVGVLRALNGITGTEIFTVSDQSLRVNTASSIATGDIDLDGYPEIIACDSTGSRLIAFEHDGTYKWRSQNLEAINWGAPSLADLNRDGKPEIIIGRQVLDSNGTLLWTGTGGRGYHSQTTLGPLSLVADVNLDGYPEIIAGNTAYNRNGQIIWQQSYPDGYNAIGNFDDDQYPEIVLVTVGNVRLLEHNGNLKWGPVSIPGGGRGGPPTVADFNGDGKVEIGVAGSNRYSVLDATGKLLWSSVTQDLSSNVTGSSVFDFEGDGSSEVVYRDELKFRIYAGSNGAILYETPMSSCTWHEYVLVADVDNDNNAEIVAVANNNCGLGIQRGVFVLKDDNDNWVNTRKIWNQHTYHITNVNNDGTIPKNEQNNWEIYNNYRCNSLLPGHARRTADITASYITDIQTNYPASVRISARIGNGGAASQIAGVDVAFYDGDPYQGGTIIGTVKTINILNPGEYEDVPITWNNPASGVHMIYVVADKDSKINECKEDNNLASAEIFIGKTPPLVYVPDLSISSSDVSIIPPDTIEGQPAVIAAIIHSIGNLGASDVNVSFFDGDPQNGGTLIEAKVVLTMDVGATAFVEIPWDTFGQSGRNYVHVVIDPYNTIAESNENNNTTLISVDVIPPTKPDLAVTSSDIVLSNNNPGEGETITLNATVHNLGLAIGNVEASLYDGDPSAGGRFLSSRSTMQIVPFGGTAIFSFEINTLGLSGIHNLFVSVDPDNRIDEMNETNNLASKSTTIGQAGLSSGIATDKPAYQANEDVTISARIKNLSEYGRTVDAKILIEDSSGVLVKELTTLTNLSFEAGEEKAFDNLVFNTGATLSGAYQAHLIVLDGQKQVGDALAAFIIGADIGVNSMVATDKMTYQVYEPVTITSIVQSTSANYILTDLTGHITLKDSAGAALFTDTKTIPILTPGSRLEFNSFWNTAANAAGIYTVMLEILKGTTSLSIAQTSFSIAGSPQTGEGITGTITASPSPVYRGDKEAVAYSITNIGNMDIANLQIQVLVVNPDTKEIKHTYNASATITMGSASAGGFSISTIPLEPRKYLVILQVQSPAMSEPKTIANALFEVIPGLEATKGILDMVNLLVWINDKCNHHPAQKGVECPEPPSHDCIRADLVERILREAAINYYIVYDKDAFEYEMRNPFYTDFMILGDHAPLTDHYADELREQVYAGKGLFSSLYLKHGIGIGPWHEDDPLFGLTYHGKLPGFSHKIDIPEGLLSAAVSFKATGDALRVEVDDPNQILGWIGWQKGENCNPTPKEYPGIVQNQYGIGKTLFFAFDIGKTLDEESYQIMSEIIKKGLSLIHTPANTELFAPYQYVPIAITLKDLDGAIDLRITETYPQGIKIYDPYAGKWITDHPWQFDIHLDSEATETIFYYAFTPDQAGSHVLQTAIEYAEEGNYYPCQMPSVTLPIAQDAAQTAQQILAALDALQVSRYYDRAAIKLAMMFINNVKTRTVRSFFDAEKNIHDILKAVDAVLSIESADTSDIRLMMDELLKIWEAKAYAFPRSQPHS